jgi:hypothetical protein
LSCELGDSDCLVRAHDSMALQNCSIGEVLRFLRLIRWIPVAFAELTNHSLAKATPPLPARPSTICLSTSSSERSWLTALAAASRISAFTGTTASPLASRGHGIPLRSCDRNVTSLQVVPYQLFKSLAASSIYYPASDGITLAQNGSNWPFPSSLRASSRWIRRVRVSTAAVGWDAPSRKLVVTMMGRQISLQCAANQGNKFSFTITFDLVSEVIAPSMQVVSSLIGISRLCCGR